MSSKRNNNTSNLGGINIHRPATKSDFDKINRDLMSRGYVAIDVLRKGDVRDVSLAINDASNTTATDMAAGMGSGALSSGPLARVAYSFYGTTNAIEHPVGTDGKPLGEGYVKWGAADNIPSVIPSLAKSSPYTAAPLRYIADLTAGNGVRLMYRKRDGSLIDYKDAGDYLQQRIEDIQKKEPGRDPVQIPPLLADPGTPDNNTTQQGCKESSVLQRARQDFADWDKSWNGFEEPLDPEDPHGETIHVPGAKEFLEDNNLDLHLAECMQDNVMLDMYFPTVGLQRGRARQWSYPSKPRIIRVDMLPAHSTRLELMNANRHINHVYFSDSLRTKGAMGVTTVTAGEKVDTSFKLYPCCMPQHLLADLRYIIESNDKVRIKNRPTWIVCPTFYPSNLPYYQQPSWWSVFTSKAFDFSATILYDKYKQRENNTSWGKIIYISLDYLDQMFADEGYQGNPEKQQQFIDDLDSSMEEFLRHRENNGKMMRQFMWIGQDGKEHRNVEVVDVKETSNDQVKAGKEELELSTSPIFLALQVDPRLVGVPMVAASNGGTALREMQLLKQQMLSIHQRSYCRFLDAVATYNEWNRAEWHIKQQTLTTLDNSKTGTVETIAGDNA